MNNKDCSKLTSEANESLRAEVATCGFVDRPTAGIDLVAEIKRLKQQKNAVILAHYYTEGVIQDIADFVGDSLALAQKAAKSTADIIVMCGVHFMGETCKILCPTKKVLVPDMNAGCSLADSCPADAFGKFVQEHPDHTVIAYVNTTAAVKYYTDIVVTSTNARQIVESLPADAKIIFAPDRNLGNYINSVTGRNMLLWDGACHVHEQFSTEQIMLLKQQYPQAKVLAHPECKRPVLLLADHVGSTAALLKFAVQDESCDTFIVATESGILHEMQKQAPQKHFIPVPPEVSEGTRTCSCNECAFMRLNTLQKLYNTLLYELPEISVDPAIIDRARKPIDKMLEISAQLGL
jgi:quinolinate synthase